MKMDIQCLDFGQGTDKSSPNMTVAETASHVGCYRVSLVTGSVNSQKGRQKDQKQLGRDLWRMPQSYVCFKNNIDEPRDLFVFKTGR